MTEDSDLGTDPAPAPPRDLRLVLHEHVETKSRRSEIRAGLDEATAATARLSHGPVAARTAGCVSGMTRASKAMRSDFTHLEQELDRGVELVSSRLWRDGRRPLSGR